MSYILVIWTLVAVEGYYGDRPQSDWRPIGTFANASACQHAIKLLGRDTINARCLPTDTKKATEK